MGQKKDIKLVKKLLKNEARRAMYSPEELQYMDLWLMRQRVQRQRRKAEKKANKGFAND